MNFKVLSKKKIANILPDIIYNILFGIFFFIIIYKVYSPDILYFKLQPFFAFESSFLEYYQTQNNCNIVLLSNFLLQFMHYPIFGSLIVTSLLIILSLVYRKLFNLSINKGLKGIEFIPAILLLASLKTYTFGLESILIFLITGLFLIGNRTLSNIRIGFKIVIQMLFLVVVFFVFDLLVSFALLVFLITDEIFTLKSSGKYIAIPLNILLLVIITYVFKGVQVSKAIFFEVAASNPRITISTYWHIIVFHIAAIILIGLFADNKRIENLSNKIPPFLRRVWIFVFLLVLNVIFFNWLYIFEKKYNAEIEYYASLNKWGKVLRYRNQVGMNDRISRFILNQSLFHSHKMPQNLFLVPQEWGENTLFLTKAFTRECTMQNSNLFFDMGFVKAAEYWAIEAQTSHLYSPEILLRLANCTILLDDYPLARKYLLVLSKSIVYKELATKLLGYLNENDSIQLKKLIFDNRKIEYNTGYIDYDRPDLDIIRILDADPGNKMAFEYLMTYYLLQSELGKFMHYLSSYIDEIGYARMPEIYQEASLLYNLSIDAPREQIISSVDKDVLNRFSQFNNILIKHKMDVKAARKDLQRAFGNTYWYYVRYTSPKVTGTTLKKKK